MHSGPHDPDAAAGPARRVATTELAKVQGPTQTLDASETWAPRRGLARSVGIAIHVMPFVCAMATSLVLGRLLPRPHGYWIAAWWLALVGGAQVALRVAERGMQRFVPLSTLLDVSAVFPDHAPSRFSLALRMGNVQKSNKAARLAVQEGLPANLDEALSVALAMVNMLGDHDRGTRGHSERVRAYSELLGEELGLDRHARQRLKWGAILHDIGKLAVPAEILNKPGKPDADEWAILQTHPGHATRILAPLEAWLGDAFHAADQHHERWDGRGYPNGLAGHDISLSARIVAVADAFTVMTTARAYKKPMSIALARRELTRGAGTQFDPAVVRAMLSLSIGRVTRTAGPAAALVNIPFFGSLAAGASAVPAAVATGAVAAGVTAIAVVASPVTPDPLAVRSSVVRPPAMEWTAPLRWDGDPPQSPTASGVPSKLALQRDRPTTTTTTTTDQVTSTLGRPLLPGAAATGTSAIGALAWQSATSFAIPTGDSDTSPTHTHPEPTEMASPSEPGLTAPPTADDEPRPTSGTTPAAAVATTSNPPRTNATTTTAPPDASTTTTDVPATSTTRDSATTTQIATTVVSTTVAGATTLPPSTTPSAASTTMTPTTTTDTTGPSTTESPTTVPPTTVPPTTIPTTVVETTTPTTAPSDCRGNGKGKATGNPHC